MAESRQPVRIAIIGSGPKGLYTLERIVAYAKRVNYPIIIHLFNETRYFASGNVYRTDQPEYLLMNFANKHINVWPQTGLKPLVDNPLSLIMYLIQIENYKEPSEELENQYVPRKVVGRYLEWCMAEILNTLPNYIKVEKHIETVTQLKKKEDQFYISSKGKEHDTCIFDLAILTTGHPWDSDTTSKSNYIPFVYPVQQMLVDTPTHDRVIIKGFGLTAIDAVLALTEGRGGYFLHQPNGIFQYKSSSKEPVCIYPYSLSGLPMIPRSPHAAPAMSLKIFTNETIKRLKSKDKLDFEKDLWPLMRMEYNYVYKKATDRLRKKGKKFTSIIPEEDEFDINKLLFYQLDASRPLHEQISSLMRLYGDAIGHTAHPIHTVLNVHEHVMRVFHECYNHCGLNPNSHKVFQNKYAGAINRVFYGPPMINYAKMLALIEAGILQLQYVIKPDPGFSSDDTPKYDSSGMLSTMVDARIPKIRVSATSNNLYGNLVKDGIARLLVNTSGKESFAPGCIEINNEGQIVDEHGIAHSSLYAYGTPTEGNVFDNDSLSRDCHNFSDSFAQGVMNVIESKSTTQTTYA